MRKLIFTSILSLFSSVRLGSSTPNTEFRLPLEITTTETSLNEQLSLKNVKHKAMRRSVSAEQSFRQEDKNLQASLRESKSMITWDSVVNMVKRRESLQLKPYRCPGGHLSVGYGHLITKGEDILRDGITEHQADSLLYNDMKYYKDWVQKNLKLKGNQLKALTHFCYAFGTTKLLKSELYDKVVAKEPIDDEILRWVKIKGRKNSSLMRQRNLELQWYNSQNDN